MNRSYKPKKKFGQHFLKDIKILQKISDNITKIFKKNILIEVGAGQGALTEFILKNIYVNHNRLFLIEIDEDMIKILNRKFQYIKDNIIEQDFLKVDLNKQFDKQSLNIIGNFPYNISSQIIFKILENKEIIDNVICMLQKDFALRIAANPKSKNYGIPSVLIQENYKVEYLFDVSPNCFDPPPKVYSSVISLTRKFNNSQNYNEEKFKKLIKISFSNRRKILKNTFKNFLDSTILSNEIFKKRAEELSIQDFKYLYNIIEKKFS